MKKFIYLLGFVLVGLLSSCAKENPFFGDEKSDGKVFVSIKVDGFEQELVPFPKPSTASAEKGIFSETPGSGSTDLRDHINMLDIYVYHSTNPNPVDYVRQYADDDNFGVYEKYFDGNPSPLYIAFHGIKLEDGESVEWVNVERRQDIGVRIAPKPKEAFFVAQQLSMRDGGGTFPSLKLSRYVGRLDLSLEEELPDINGYLNITIENTGKYFNPFGGYGFHEIPGAGDPPYQTFNAVPISTEEMDNGVFNTSIYFIPTETIKSGPTSVTVKIAAYDDDNNLVKEMSIPNVLIQGNKITKLKGTIFTFPNLIQEVGLEDRWDGEFPEREF